MGTLFYGPSQIPIDIDDRTLAHLKIALLTKLRHNESFTLSWKHGDDQPAGRSTIWLHPAIPLRFVFDGPDRPELNTKWIEALMRAANSTGGVELVPEYLDTAEAPIPPGRSVLVGRSAGRARRVQAARS
ncbi:DUF7882 family protein [Agromyces soli]